MAASQVRKLHAPLPPSDFPFFCLRGSRQANSPHSAPTSKDTEATRYHHDLGQQIEAMFFVSLLSPNTALG